MRDRIEEDTPANTLQRITEANIPYPAIKAFCQKWKVVELALFGSVLREDFSNDSDIDILISFEEDAPWSLFDLVNMQTELEGIFGRAVDLVEKDAIQNPFRRRSIFGEKKTVYATR